MMKNILPDDHVVEKTRKSLEANGIKTVLAENGQEAKKLALEMIKKDSTVMTVSSVTLKQIGLEEEIEHSTDLISLKKKVNAFAENERRDQARRINSAPDYVLGSVHAVTEEGQVLVASNSGSQISPYAFSAAHVVWIVGVQKIVKDMKQAMVRLQEYVIPLEDKRLFESYGMHTVARKLLIINSESKPDRITMILVKENLGF